MRDSSRPYSVGGTSSASHVAARMPSARRCAHQQAAAGQAAHDLLDEQRIAAGARRDQVAHRRQAVAGGAPSRWIDQRARVLLGQRARARWRMARHAPARSARASGRCEASSISGRSASWSTTSRSRSTEAASAHCRSSSTIISGCCDRRRSISARAASVIWRCSCSGSMSRGLRLLDAEQVVQHLRDRLGLVRARRPAPAGPAAACRRATSSESSRLDPVGRRGTARRRCRRSARPATSRLARRTPVAARRPSACEAREQLGQQARLAGAGLADDADDLGAAPLHALECGQQRARSRRRARPAAPPARARRGRAPSTASLRARRAADAPAAAAPCRAAPVRPARLERRSDAAPARASLPSTSTVPGRAADSRRDAVFTVSPVTA